MAPRSLLRQCRTSPVGFALLLLVCTWIIVWISDGNQSTPPRCHWMTPAAWNDIATLQAQIPKLVEYRRALLQFNDSRYLDSPDVAHHCSGSWTERFVPAAVRPRRSTHPTHGHNTRQLLASPRLPSCLGTLPSSCWTHSSIGQTAGSSS